MSGIPSGSMVQVVLVVAHLEARGITIEVVLSGISFQPIKFIVVLQSAMVYTELAQASHLSMHYQHRVHIMPHMFRVLRADIQFLKGSHIESNLARGIVAFSVDT